MFSTLANSIIAYSAGIVTFFAGCLVPILPIYISYLAGSAVQKKYSKRYFLKNTLLFTAGYTGIFLLFGYFVRSFSVIVAPYQASVTLLIGILLIVLGAHIASIVSLPLLNKTGQIRVKTLPVTWFSSLVLGVLFGFAWTPCIGPVLATILLWTSTQETSSQGSLLLVMFSLGLSTPFMAVGLLFETLYPRIKRLNTYSPIIKRVAGLLLIVFGILLVTGLYAHVASFAKYPLGQTATQLQLQ